MNCWGDDRDNLLRDIRAIPWAAYWRRFSTAVPGRQVGDHTSNLADLPRRPTFRPTGPTFGNHRRTMLARSEDDWTFSLSDAMTMTPGDDPATLTLGLIFSGARH